MTRARAFVAALACAVAMLAAAGPAYAVDEIETLSPAGSSAQAPQVAANPSGDVVVAWVRAAAGRPGAVRARVRPAGGGWRTPVTLAPRGVRSVKVAIDGAGRAAVSWVRLGAGQQRLQVRVFDPAARRWSATHTFSGRAWRSSLTLANGIVAVSWLRGPLRARRVAFASGAPGRWSSTTFLTRSGNSTEVQHQVDRGGRATVAWLRENANGERRVWVREQTGPHRWAPAVQLTRALDAYELGLAVNRDGTAVVAYALNGGPDVRPLQARHRPLRGGRWSAAATLIDVPGAEYYPVRVGSNGVDDDFLVVWADLGDVSVSHRPGAGVWEPARALNAIGAGASLPEVTMDRTGLATIAWTEGNSAVLNNVVRVRQLPRGGSWGALKTLSDPSLRRSFLDVSAASGSQAVAAWSWLDPAGDYRIQSRTFDPIP